MQTLVLFLIVAQVISAINKKYQCLFKGWVTSILTYAFGYAKELIAREPANSTRGYIFMRCKGGPQTCGSWLSEARPRVPVSAPVILGFFYCHPEGGTTEGSSPQAPVKILHYCSE